MLSVAYRCLLFVFLFGFTVMGCSTKEDSDWMMYVYPIPNSGWFTVHLVGMTPEDVMLQVFDSSGHLLDEKEFTGALGGQRINYQFTEQASGPYIVILRSENTTLQYATVPTVDR